MTDPSPPEPRPDHPPPAVRRAHRIARLLDDTFPLPGTDRRIGIDGLVGLVPGIGDALGAALSASVLLIAAHAGVRPAILARMAGNVLLELALGAIPLLGDLFDFAWKANRRNAALFEKAMADPERTRRTSQAMLVGVAATLLITLGAVGYGIFALIGWLLGALSGGG